MPFWWISDGRIVFVCFFTAFACFLLLLFLRCFCLFFLFVCLFLLAFTFLACCFVCFLCMRFCFCLHFCVCTSSVFVFCAPLSAFQLNVRWTTASASPINWRHKVLSTHNMPPNLEQSLVVCWHSMSLKPVNANDFGEQTQCLPVPSPELLHTNSYEESSQQIANQVTTSLMDSAWYIFLNRHFLPTSSNFSENTYQFTACQPILKRHCCTLPAKKCCIDNRSFPNSATVLAIQPHEVSTSTSPFPHRHGCVNVKKGV